MSDTEPTEELVSLAGRVLAGGNPLDNEQVMAALAKELRTADGMFTPVTAVREATRVVLGAYFENALSLAGHVLGEESAEAAAERLAEVDLQELAPKVAVLGLLKGMHPQGTTWAHLAMAIDLRGSELKASARELIDEGKVRQDDATVTASLDVMADKTIPALPWPASSI